MHAALHEILDADFLHAWRHGMIIKCADGVTHRVFPRIFTYLADYQEKYVGLCSTLLRFLTHLSRVLLATIRDKGICPCPRCLTPMDSIHKMGTPHDLRFRTNNRRKDSARQRQLVKEARAIIYDNHRAVGNAEVEALLQPTLLVPTIVS